MPRARGVLLIYTGGTIGSVPSRKNDPGSTLVPTNSFVPLLNLVPGFHRETNTMVLENKEVPVAVEDWNEPMDSANLKVEHWYQMAHTIRDRYHEFEGFVILHGTDTLAYSASALSFILKNLSKPVVLTGSQRPLIRSRSDAMQNLVTSIEIAASKSLQGFSIPEVCVFFRDTLMRGNRTTKTSANDFRAFSSPNSPPLGRAAKRFRLDWKQVYRQRRAELDLLPSLEQKVISLDLFPGMSVELLKNVLNSPGLRGVVLKTFGAGNAPTFPHFLEVLRRASVSGIVILDVTQCWSGEVEMGLYETSAKLLECGVVSGMDMTPEAGLTKMMAVLGTEKDPDRARSLLQINLRGELAGSIFHYHYPGSAVANANRCVDLEPEGTMVLGKTHFQSNRLDRAILRFFGCESRNHSDDVLKIYLQDPATGKLRLLGELKAGQKGDKTTLSLGVPVMRLKFLRYCSHPKMVVESKSPGGEFSWESVDLSLMTLS